MCDEYAKVDDDWKGLCNAKIDEIEMLNIDISAYRVYAKELKSDNNLLKAEVANLSEQIDDVKETLSKVMQKNVELAAKNKALMEQNEEYKKMLKEALKN